MPRSKEAIATLRGYAKVMSTGGDEFAKGILAAIRWMTDPESPVPFADLADDMPDDGGWEAPQPQVAAAPVPRQATVSVAPAAQVVATQTPAARRIITPEDANWNAPVNVPQVEEGEGLSLAEAERLAANPRMMLPGSVQAAAQEHEWVRELLKEVQVRQEGVPVSDANAVIVGAGLGDEPLLAGGGEY